MLVSIIKKRLQLNADLHTILRILSLTLFEKTPLDTDIYIRLKNRQTPQIAGAVL